MVLVSLQHFQLETSHVSHEYHHNFHIAKCLDCTYNLILHISLNLEQTQAFEEEITDCGVSHPPLDLLHNKILVVNGSNDEQCFQGNVSHGLISKSLVHPFFLESEN